VTISLCTRQEVFCHIFALDGLWYPPSTDRSIALMSMQITAKPMLPLLVCGLGVLGLGVAPAAEAKQFQKLVQVGQTIPGDAQPLAEIIQPTIGSNGQVAVILRTKQVETPGFSIPTRRTFQGMYTIAANGTIDLLQGDTTVLGYRNLQLNEFSAPTISQGKVGYLSLNENGSGPIPTPRNNLANFQVGTAGNRTTLQAEIQQALEIRATSGKSNAAFVNGNGYYRSRLYQAPNQPLTTTNIFGVINGKPQVLLSGGDAIFEGSPLSDMNSSLRASSGLIVLSRTRNVGSLGDTTDLYERPIAGGTFKKLNSFLGASCGISVSQDNIVACFDTTTSKPPTENGGAPTSIAVRLGRQGAFTPIVVPANRPDRRVSNPSISQKNIAFQVNDQVSPSDTSAIASIYFSQNGQAPQKVVTTGDKLDGKTVKSVQLSESGRAIIDKSIVFTATFTDGVTALYRVDL
jgi:hypothetical protein